MKLKFTIPTSNHQKGFSLLELIMVMVLAGIIMLAVGIRPSGSFTAYQDAQELAQAIRHTQERSLNHTGQAQEYAIEVGAADYSLVPVPDQIHRDIFGCDAQGKCVLAGAALSPQGRISFNGRGVPTCTGGLSCANSAATIQVNHGGDSYSLRIEPYTGFVAR